MTKTNTDFYPITLPTTGNIVHNAQLRYVNIDKVLADSKSDRASKYDGFLNIAYQDSADTLILQSGEIINAVRFTTHDRFVIPVTEVIKKAKTLKAALLNLDKTEMRVIQLLLASILYAPEIKNVPGHCVDFKTFLKQLNTRRWNGFLEFSAPHEINFLTVEAGIPRKTFFSEKLALDHGKKFMLALVDLLGTKQYKISAYPYLQLHDKFLKQIHPAQIVLFSKVFLAVFNYISQEMGATSAHEMFRATQQELDEDFPLLLTMAIDRQGNLIYNGISQPEVFTDSLSAWFNGSIMKITQTTKIEIIPAIEDILKPDQVTLNSLGFYNNCSMLKRGI
ncbi:hypothetical protein ACFL27_11920 [candidate division CSSED10-310 bacterium]|uniref:Uncharacterized protein n=1 Tax=candidate division CSSED10-310 bacterium TaxID=2855610 RepID=A0ABV6YXF9_UNCC1